MTTIFHTLHPESDDARQHSPPALRMASPGQGRRHALGAAVFWRCLTFMRGISPRNT